jgi:hypothetical protein
LWDPPTNKVTVLDFYIRSIGASIFTLTSTYCLPSLAVRVAYPPAIAQPVQFPARQFEVKLLVKDWDFERVLDYWEREYLERRKVVWAAWFLVLFLGRGVGVVWFLYTDFSPYLKLTSILLFPTCPTSPRPLPSHLLLTTLPKHTFF